MIQLSAEFTCLCFWLIRHYYKRLCLVPPVCSVVFYINPFKLPLITCNFSVLLECILCFPPLCVASPHKLNETFKQVPFILAFLHNITITGISACVQHTIKEIHRMTRFSSSVQKTAAAMLHC